MSGVKRMNKNIPKKVGKKKSAGPYKKYSKDLIELAVDAVENNKISICEAEKRFDIPQRTHDRVKIERVTFPKVEEENTDCKIRSQKTLSVAELRYECVACKVMFQFNSQLKYHIRRHHFNRVGRIPHAETQEVDQVWYERVVNTEAVVKMRKVSENVLIIQRITDLTDLPTEVISEEQEDVLDVRDIYPVNSKTQKNFLECYVCHKSFGRRLLGKHFAKAHAHLVKKKCDACQMRFKRAYNCARHVCPESIHKILKKKENDEWAVVD